MTFANLTLTINTQALRDNFGILRTRVGPHVAICPAVKANGYGLGVDVVVPIFDQAGAHGFYVANGDEGVAVRRFTQKPIYNFDGFTTEDTLKALLASTLTPVVNTPAQIDIIIRTAPETPFVLHVDTGMNRLGLSADELDQILPTLPRLNPILILSHFSCADHPDQTETIAQAQRFETARQKVNAALGREIPASLANSSGVFRDATYHYDVVRPGMSLYGLNPTPETGNPMHRVVTLTARVLQVRMARAGETVGYGATHRFPRDTRLATLGGGYADGLIRALSNTGRVYIGGTACPIVGRVSMDLITVELPDECPPVSLGDTAEWIGDHQSADDLARDAGTIGYEILTQLSHRAARHIV